MALDGQEILYFMSVGVSQTPTKEHCFEERRIQDYLSAYQATGRPPQPCPQSPDTPNARAALGLPPLFVPTAIPVPAESPSTNTPATRPSDLPAHHEFRPTKSKPTGETLECISAQTLYACFSLEELRCHAYAAGNKMPPPAVAAMASEPETTATVYPFYADDARTTAYNTVPAPPGGGTPDYLMSIAASPKFDKHAFEELRIAYLAAGKEVGSSEIPTRGALPAQPAPSLFGRPRGDAFSTGSLKLF